MLPAVPRRLSRARRWFWFSDWSCSRRDSGCQSRGTGTTLQPSPPLRDACGVPNPEAVVNVAERMKAQAEISPESVSSQQSVTLNSFSVDVVVMFSVVKEFMTVGRLKHARKREKTRINVFVNQYFSSTVSRKRSGELPSVLMSPDSACSQRSQLRNLPQRLWKKLQVCAAGFC